MSTNPKDYERYAEFIEQSAAIIEQSENLAPHERGVLNLISISEHAREDVLARLERVIDACLAIGGRLEVGYLSVAEADALFDQAVGELSKARARHSSYSTALSAGAELKGKPLTQEEVRQRAEALRGFAAKIRTRAQTLPDETTPQSH
jgi:hypothetical protein